jgi:hypothetical protein
MSGSGDPGSISIGLGAIPCEPQRRRCSPFGTIFGTSRHHSRHLSWALARDVLTLRSRCLEAHATGGHFNRRRRVVKHERRGPQRRGTRHGVRQMGVTAFVTHGSLS